MAADIPGIMRLGLTGGVPAGTSGRAGAGFRYETDALHRVVPFERVGTAGGAAAGGGLPGRAATAPLGASRGGSLGGGLGASGGLATRRPPTAPFVPPKFALAGQKLTFKGFFQESVPESALETSRRRHLVLQYHLEDDTVEVLEPAVRNDGLPHGRFLKRMRLPDITIEVLRVGGTVEVFGRALRLYACDEFTRKFFAGLGTPQPADEGVDEDAFLRSQRHAFARSDPSTFHGVKASSITRFIEAAKGSSRTQSFKKDIKGRYLALDGQVLRFLVQWDDTKTNMFGDKHLYWLSYFLATEDCEIREVKGKKAVMGWPTLLRRMRIPRRTIVHDDRMRSVEDVTGDEDYYNHADFRVGDNIVIFGREMMIADCDDFTQGWYEEHMGVDQRGRRVDLTEEAPERPEVPVPPHIGIGSEEDTLESWKHLVPRPPRVDFAKLRNATGRTARFLARLVSDDPIQAERIFRITFFMDDGEVAVHEPKVRNSGLEGGVFQKKLKTRNDLTGEPLKIADLVVGREVCIKAHRMAIFEEERQPEAPVADVDQIVRCLKTKLTDASASLRKMFRKFDTDKSQSISYDEFTAMLSYYSLGLSKYEAITLFKAFEDHPGFMSYANFMRAFDRAEETVDAGREVGVAETSRQLTARCTHEELDAMILEAKGAARREQFRIQQELLVARIARAFRNSRTAQLMHDNFRRFDTDKDHLVNKAEFRASMKRVLSLGDEDIDSLVAKFYAAGQETLNYEEFMSVIHDYADKPMRS